MVSVNSVHPGMIQTLMVEKMARSSDAEAADFMDNMAQLHPLGHANDPMDIAWAAVYLASDEAKSVTGSELVIEGGYTAR